MKSHTMHFLVNTLQPALSAFVYHHGLYTDCVSKNVNLISTQSLYDIEC